MCPCVRRRTAYVFFPKQFWASGLWVFIWTNFITWTTLHLTHRYLFIHFAFSWTFLPKILIKPIDSFRRQNNPILLFVDRLLVYFYLFLSSFFGRERGRGWFFVGLFFTVKNLYFVFLPSALPFSASLSDSAEACFRSLFYSMQIYLQTHTQIQIYFQNVAAFTFAKRQFIHISVMCIMCGSTESSTSTTVWIGIINLWNNSLLSVNCTILLSNRTWCHSTTILFIMITTNNNHHHRLTIVSSTMWKFAVCCLRIKKKKYHDESRNNTELQPENPLTQ